MGFGATVLWLHALPLSPLSREDTPNGVLSLVPLRESIELTIPVLSGGGLLPQLIVVWDQEPVLSSIYWFPLHLDQSEEEGEGGETEERGEKVFIKEKKLWFYDDKVHSFSFFFYQLLTRKPLKPEILLFSWSFIFIGPQKSTKEEKEHYLGEIRTQHRESRNIRMEVKGKEGRSDKRRSSSLLSTLPCDLAFSSSPSAVCNCLSSCVCMCDSSLFQKYKRGKAQSRMYFMVNIS